MSTAGKSGKIHFFHFYQIAFVLVFLLVLFLFSEFAAPVTTILLLVHHFVTRAANISLFVCCLVFASV